MIKFSVINWYHWSIHSNEKFVNKERKKEKRDVRIKFESLKIDGMCSRWRTIDDRRRTEVTGVRVSHCCARQGGYGVVPTLVRGYFNGPPLWICRCLITAVLNSALRRAIPNLRSIRWNLHLKWNYVRGNRILLWIEFKQKRDTFRPVRFIYTRRRKRSEKQAIQLSTDRSSRNWKEFLFHDYFIPRIFLKRSLYSYVRRKEWLRHR